MDLMWCSSLFPSGKRRRRRAISGMDQCSKILATEMGATLPLLGGRHGVCPRVNSSTLATSAAWPPRRRAKKKSSIAVSLKAITVCICLLSGRLPTVVVGFSAVCTPPPRAPQEHKQQLSTPPSTTPQARRFLEEIISGKQEQHPTTLHPEERERGGSKASVVGVIDAAASAAAAAATVVIAGADKKREIEMQYNPTRADPQPESNNPEGLGLMDEREERSFGPALLETKAASPPAEHPRSRFSRGVEERMRASKPHVAERVAQDAEKTSGAATRRKSRHEPEGHYNNDPTSNIRKKPAIHSMCADLCQAKLLTRDEEYELGTKIQALMSYTAMRDRLLERLDRPPTATEWAESCCMTVPELQESLQVCSSAKEAMIRANMRMVISIARKYQNMGVPLADLIQEGSLGLVRAVEKFDPERGFKLSTYSAWWIQQAVFKGIAHQNRVIRLPMHVHNLLQSIKKARRELKTNDGPEPTDSQVALYLDMPVQRLKRYLAVTKDTVSFEMPTCAQGSSSNSRLLGETLASGETVHPEKESDARLFRARLKQMVQELPEDERTVVSLRFGLDNGKPKTLGQIADIVRTSTPYVRRVETTAMRKLRSPDRKRRLLEFSLPPAAAAAAAEELLARKG